MKENKTKTISEKRLKTVSRCFILSVTAIFLVAASLETITRLYYKDKISHNVFVNGINVSEFNKSKFVDHLTNTNSGLEKIIITIDGSEYQLLLSDIGYSTDSETGWRRVYKLKKNYLDNPYSLSFLSFFKKINTEKSFSYDEQALSSELEKILSVYSNNPVFETVLLGKNGIEVVQGKNGSTIDSELLRKTLFDAIQKQMPAITVELKQVNASIPNDKKRELISLANNLIGKKIIITLDKERFEIDDKTLIATLNDRTENNFENINKLTEDVATTFNREAKNSTFVFENGKVSEFVPSEDGIATDINQLKNEIAENRNSLANSNVPEAIISLPHKRTYPEITTASINNLGIKEKIGMGYSTFRGSIVSRVHNIKLASSKFNGVLISPGETLSFNKTLGDVSKVTGYQPAYIIKDGQTVLGDGGGVCQVSTTFFRAALNAGLPIIERRSHSYRVAYYEQGFSPGLDATVFDPTTDLKIKNDTENYILIQTVFNEKENRLEFDLYGTNDGRVSTVGKPVIKGSTPPPEDLYIDDPTLKAGIIKQIDYKAWGAKVYFNYKVEKDGVVLFEKIFYSNYQPWQAKFLRGTAV